MERRQKREPYVRDGADIFAYVAITAVECFMITHRKVMRRLRRHIVENCADFGFLTLGCAL